MPARKSGFIAGEFLLDPLGNIVLGTTAATGTVDNSGTVVYNSDPVTGTVFLNVNAGGSFKKFLADPIAGHG